VKLRQVETASGLQHLRSDLAERASIRSEGAVKQILFRALLFE
jgi:flagellar FliL protein